MGKVKEAILNLCGHRNSQRVEALKELPSSVCPACLQEKIKNLEALRDTVSISCNPPADCNDPKVLKIYMKACFDEAEKLYD